MQTAITADLLGLAPRERAFTELEDVDSLVRAHRARLLRFVTYSVGDDDVAASIVQDCFLKAWANRASFRGEASVSTWLTSIAVNLVRDHQRTRKNQFWRKAAKTATDIMKVASILPGTECSPERRLLARERAAAVASSLDALSTNQRAVFLMRFADEMELGEIAVAMDMPVNTVKTHLYRAIRAVRQKVGTPQ